MPPLALLNAGRCERLWLDLALLFFAWERFGGLLEDNSSSARVSMLSGTMCSFPLLQEIGCFAWLLSCMSFFCQDYTFFQPEPANGCFPIVDVRRDPAIPSSVLLALPVSSSCLDANEEIDPRATGSPDCWSLHLC